MSAQFIQLEIPGLVEVIPDVFPDARGFFQEAYQAERYFAHGIRSVFVQDNYSYSKAGVLRGLHFQLHKPQAKLISVVQGAIYDVAVDLRWGSPTFKQWKGVELSAQNHEQFYIPPGFAHGFCVLSEHALIHYKCSEFFDPKDDRGVIWNDPELAICWPLSGAPILSEKDSVQPTLARLREEDFPQFTC